MGDYIVHRARFFNYQPKAVQSMSYDDAAKKLAISRFDYLLFTPSKSIPSQVVESVNLILKIRQ